MEIAVTLPANCQLRDVPAYARRVERLGFDVLHVPETVHDPFSTCTLALEHTDHLVVRTSMVVAFPRSPMLTAYAAWDLTRFSGGRFQLGMATQVRGNIVGRYSTAWREPVAQLRDYVDSVRAIFRAFETGEPLEHSGSHYRFDRLQPYFNPGATGHPPPMIWTGGVNRQMITLAGEISDGFVCHPTGSHPEYLAKHVLPALQAGAAQAGRADGGPRLVVVPKPIVASAQDELVAARDAQRAELAFLYTTPAYRRTLELFGLESLGDQLTAMAKASDWSNLADRLSDEVLATIVPQGTFDEIPAVLECWYAGRCDGISLSVPDSSEHDAELTTMVQDSKAIAARH